MVRTARTRGEKDQSAGRHSRSLTYVPWCGTGVNLLLRSILTRADVIYWSQSNFSWLRRSECKISSSGLM